MKKILLPIAGGFIALVTLFNTSFAQFSGKSANQFNLDNSSLAKLNSLAPVPANINSLTASNLKAVKDFRKSFKNVSNERWYSGPEGFTVKFEKDNTKTRVEYNKKGRWICTFKYYDESIMPKDVRTLVKSTYFDYAITQVIEIHYGNAMAHIVQISNNDGFKNIRVIDGEMSILEEFENANKK